MFISVIVEVLAVAAVVFGSTVSVR